MQRFAGSARRIGGLSGFTLIELMIVVAVASGAAVAVLLL
jgi:prepilin-type N-terminal cleavage/methylation domain-containing protein